MSDESPAKVSPAASSVDSAKTPSTNTPVVDAGAASTNAPSKMEAEAVTRQQQQQQELAEQTRVMFQHVSTYLRSELSATGEDYKLLEIMNKTATEQYKEMNRLAQGFVTQMQDLDQKYEELRPYSAQIDQVEASVTELEKVVEQLQQYTKRLEDKFKTADKSSLLKVPVSQP